MAMQATDPAPLIPSAQVVGNAFVDQYYNILHQSPELVYKFYQDSSVLSRPDPSGIMTSVTTMQAINDKIQSLDYKNYKAEIRTADAQDSYEAGVIVLVTGCLTGKDNMRRKFAQSFFLAPQEKGYFVLNDVFRYVEEDEPLQINSAMVNGINDSAPAPTVTATIEPSSVPDYPVTASEAEDLNNCPEVCDPSENGDEWVIEEEVVDEPPTHSLENETITEFSSESTVANEGKISYASIVKVPRGPTSSSSVYIPTSNARALPAIVDQQTVASPKPSVEPETSPPTSDAAPENNNVHEEGHSIYVRNLPLNASITLLEEEFKKFGPIKRGGIQVRSNKQHGFCFGFVEFESLGSMQNAIKASPVTIGDRQSVVEEKRTTTKVGSSGRARYNSGSGNFRSESFRGRGNYGGGRGYGRNEFRNQGEFANRPKGPGGRNAENYPSVENGSGRLGRTSGTNKNAQQENF